VRRSVTNRAIYRGFCTSVPFALRDSRRHVLTRCA
jgi:hypothetical protein